jgi:glycosyltransferase involved in cell wall biosynthesis
MRICLYASAALPSMGGQEMVVDALATQYWRAGHEVVVLAPRASWHLFLGDHSFPYRVVRHPRYFSKRRMVEFYGWWLDRVCRRWRCDIVHCHGVYPPGYLASLCCRRLGIPFVVTSHGEDVCQTQSRLDEPLILRRHVQALAAADSLVAISRFTHEGLRTLCPMAGHIADIPNGVDVARYARPLRRPPTVPPGIREDRYFLFIGRLVRQKGVDVAIEAFAKLRPEGDASLVVAGNGPESPSLQRLAQSLGIADKVHFVGRIEGDTKTYLLQNSRALVAPSRYWEAFGLVVLESYAAGRPVIASRLPGMADLMEDLFETGAPGWLVTPGAVEELADVLNAVPNEAPEGDDRDVRPTEIPNRYTWPAIAAAHLDLYAQVVSQFRRARPRHTNLRTARNCLPGQVGHPLAHTNPRAGVR